MWRYESSGHQNISLHDNVIDDIFVEKDDIFLIFSEGFDVVRTHSLNDTQKSKHTTKSQIALKSAKFVSGEVDYTISQRGMNDIQLIVHLVFLN